MYILEDFLPELMATMMAGQTGFIASPNSEPDDQRGSETMIRQPCKLYHTGETWAGRVARIVGHENNTNGEYRLQVEYNA